MSARPGPRGRGAMNVGVLGPVRTTRRVAATAVVVLVAAIVALVPSASVADDPPPYPTFFATFTTGGPLGDNRFAPGAGVVDLLDPTPTGIHPRELIGRQAENRNRQQPATNQRFDAEPIARYCAGACGSELISTSSRSGRVLPRQMRARLRKKRWSGV